MCDVTDVDQPPRERWAPLGAASNSGGLKEEATAVAAAPSRGSEPGEQQQNELQRMEEEQEQLNASLLALTSHFAQVQFRLRQVVRADAAEREGLLRELDDFAFRGCPDVRACGRRAHDAQLQHDAEGLSEREKQERLDAERQKQQELIVQLKAQLDDVERFAYQEGSSDSVPQAELMERHKVIVEELRQKLGMNLQDDIGVLSTEELRERVDAAVAQIINPAKVKEQLVDQLKTQIRDLEMFIDFLQDEVGAPLQPGIRQCTCPVHGQPRAGAMGAGVPTGHVDAEKARQMRASGLHILKRALTMLQLFAVSQFGCGAAQVAGAWSTEPSDQQDYSPLLGRLEAAVSKVRRLALQRFPDGCSAGSGSDSDVFFEDAAAARGGSGADDVTVAVRKDLAPALRDLLSHGLQPPLRSASGGSLVLAPIACLLPAFSPVRSSRGSAAAPGIHPWLIFKEYYDTKNGRAYMESPARKLSESFGLRIDGETGGAGGAGGRARGVSAKHGLLVAIHEVLSDHDRFKRSADSEFKALVCRGLNEQRLVSWLNLVCKAGTLVEAHYQAWSYMARTGFEGALTILGRLSDLQFDLAADLSVRQLKNINDAF
uniref:RUN domain-containing protein 1 isoform X1 n=1 Tax=Petromyzon marinus TaxID=7757 RepID=A0AAJ7UC40_PETMA|nr:RUN domain-containing protein 1 isoform X1 [Petromyzon marinus]